MLGLLAPAGTTYDAMTLLLNADTEEERNYLTEQWRDHKLKELNFVGIVGALLTGCLTSTGSWPTVLQNGRISPWTVRACWYSGIIFGLLSVLLAAQQSIRLHRFSAHRDAFSNIRHFMGSDTRESSHGKEIKPRLLQVFAWQASVTFLTLSVAAMITGMFILIWSSATTGPLKKEYQSWWESEAKLAVTWTIITVTAVGVFVTAQISLGLRQKTPAPCEARASSG